MRDNERKRRIFSNIIGYICVFAFFSITTYIIFIFYFKIGPTLLEKQAYGKFLFHFIFGNWLAINIYFNYTMAWLTSPGISKNYQNLAVQYPVCKKCSYRKPPRTHHCSWCSLCILRFDHHCPWLNNCIGFYNHRYFYQCCCFMSIGCLYTGSFGYREYQISLFEVQLFRHGDSFLMTADIFNTMGVNGFITYYIFMMVFLLGFILLGFSGWHGRMISRGETLFEYVLQEDYVRRYYEYGFIFVKIHDINLVENWKEFFGVDSMSEFIRRILLPSTHKPKGNGIIIDDYHIHTNLYSHKKDFYQSKQGTSNVSSGYHIIPGGYLVKKYSFESLSCQRQPITNSFSSWYQSRTTSMNDRKNNVDMNEV